MSLLSPLVFVYGSLLAGLGNHRLLRRHCARLVAPAQTINAGWTMLSLGGFPGVVHGGEDVIYSEVYRVDQDGLAALDRLEGYPTFYDREQIEVSALAGEGAPMKVWIYVLQRQVGDEPVVPGGDWRGCPGRWSA